MHSAATVILCHDEHATSLTISDPASRNALSLHTIAHLLGAIGRAPPDRLLIIRGDAGIFCTNRDGQELEIEALEAQAEFNRAFYLLLDRVNDFSMPVLAAINGVAFDCGLELALNCDLRIAKASSVFGTRDGMPQDHQSRSRRLKTLTPLSECLLAGRVRISAQQALASGGVAEVIADSDFDTHISRVAEEISAMQPADLRHLKGMLRYAGNPTTSGHLHRLYGTRTPRPR